MTYCTLDEARAAGAVGDDAAVTLAIARAQSSVEDFTGDLFEPSTRTVVARLGADGRAMLPYRVTDPAGSYTVTDHDGVAATPYAAGTFRMFSSAVEGDVDAVGLGSAWAGSNVLVYGMEPWARPRNWQGRVRVSGQFGWDVCPEGVTAATAMLAAHLSRDITPDPDGNPATPLPQTATQVDPEGNVIPVVPPFGEGEDSTATARRTTGHRAVDALLVPYQRVPLTLTAV